MLFAAIFIVFLDRAGNRDNVADLVTDGLAGLPHDLIVAVILEGVYGGVTEGGLKAANACEAERHTGLIAHGADEIAFELRAGREAVSMVLDRSAGAFFLPAEFERYLHPHTPNIHPRFEKDTLF